MALVDTGAQISIMSAALRRRHRKVLTPASSFAVRVADGGSPSVAGVCAARINIADQQTAVLFTVLDRCPYDIILGLDFLSAHSALIDCSGGLLHLELPCSDAAIGEIEQKSRFVPAGHTWLPPYTAAYVPLIPSLPFADGVYEVSPIAEVLLMRNAALPHTIVTVVDNQVELPFINFCSSAQLLPMGMSLATICLLDDYHAAALTVHDISLIATTHPPWWRSGYSIVLLCPRTRVLLSAAAAAFQKVAKSKTPVCPRFRRTLKIPRGSKLI